MLLATHQFSIVCRNKTVLTTSDNVLKIAPTPSPSWKTQEYTFHSFLLLNTRYLLLHSQVHSQYLCTGRLQVSASHLCRLNIGLELFCDARRPAFVKSDCHWARRKFYTLSDECKNSLLVSQKEKKRKIDTHKRAVVFICGSLEICSFGEGEVGYTNTRGAHM